MNVGKIVSLGFASAFAVTSMSAVVVAAETPGKIVMVTIDRGLSVLKDPALKGEDKKPERRQRLWQEIAPIFNFEEMSKRALSQYWKKRTPEERNEFVELFTNILKESYIGKTDTYSGEKIVLLREKQDEKDYASVQTKIITSSGSEVAVDYRMMNSAGKWTIYDVIIEGVSLVNNYRSQFNNILVKSTYEELVLKMKEKKG